MLESEGMDGKIHTFCILAESLIKLPPLLRRSSPLLGKITETEGSDSRRRKKNEREIVKGEFDFLWFKLIPINVSVA